MDQNVDVIIIGASFAGLAVAAPLRGQRVLLIDRKPVGTGQTSTCGTLVQTLGALGLEDAILQIHDHIVLHTPGRTFVYRVTEPFCTFDYEVACHRLREQGDAEFVQASVLRVEGPVVHTSRGAFVGGILVDASGWRAVAGRQAAPDLLRPDRLSFGLETVALLRDDGLHFWYDPARVLPAGISWVFPIGDASRIGIASYRGDSRLGGNLRRFLDQLGLERDQVHGGFIPHELREPVLGNLFLVGDAAGQCPALTAEGIRPALFFGTHLGRLLRRALVCEISLEEARSAYRELVLARKRGFDLLCLAQRLLPRLPLPLFQGVAGLATWPTVRRWWLSRYVRAFWLEPPAERAGRRPGRVA